MVTWFMAFAFICGMNRQLEVEKVVQNKTGNHQNLGEKRGGGVVLLPVSGQDEGVQDTHHAFHSLNMKKYRKYLNKIQ